ncbi:DUF6596 domain-containing protein [Luteococcus sp. H138]
MVLHPLYRIDLAPTRHDVLLDTNSDSPRPGSSRPNRTPCPADFPPSPDLPAVRSSELVPGTPVLDALCALVTLQHDRRDARADADGGLVRLADQDRSRWHKDEIDSGLAVLRAIAPTVGFAEELRLQALIAAFHATAATAADTDWAAVVRVYRRLELLTGSPVVRLNRAVAVAELSGPLEGLRVLQAAADQLPGHHRVHVVRAELLRREGQISAARDAYKTAIALCPDGPELRYLRGQLAAVESIDFG